MAREGFTPSVEHVVRWRGKMYRIVNAPIVESVRYRQEWIFDYNCKGLKYGTSYKHNIGKP